MRDKGFAITINIRIEERGVKGKLIFVAAIKLESLEIETIQEPPIVANVLKEFVNIMPLVFLKTLSSHRGIDYRIKLEPRVKALARSPIIWPYLS